MSRWAIAWLGSLVLLVLALGGRAEAATYHVDCGLDGIAGVTTAVNAAKDGDEVHVTGSCTVTTPSDWSITTKSLRLLGIGATITEAVTPATGMMIQVRTGNGKCVQFSGLTFVDGGTGADIGNGPGVGSTLLSNAVLGFLPQSGVKAWASECLRVSGLTYGNMGTTYLRIEDNWGVVDHMTANRTLNTTGARIRLETNHGPVGALCDGIVCEHGNWAWLTPSNPGDTHQVVVEDSDFNDTSTTGSFVMVDGSIGTRFTARYSDWQRWTVALHGTLQNVRGPRWMEVYRNSFTERASGATSTRGGTGVIWENQISGTTTGLFSGFKDARNSRQNGNPPFYCNGAAEFDVNATTGIGGTSLYASGTHNNNGGGQTTELIDSNPLTNWSGTSADGTNNGIYGGASGGRVYNVSNLTDNTSAIVMTSSGNTMTSLKDSPSQVWNDGDAYEIRRIEYCRDDVGVGSGTVGYTIGSGSGALDQPKIPANQPKEPLAAWGNLKGVAAFNTLTSSGQHHILSGLLTNTPRPYTIQPYRCFNGVLTSQASDACPAWGKPAECIKGSCGHPLRWRRISSAIFRNAVAVDRFAATGGVANYRPLITPVAVTRQVQPVDEM